MIYIDDSEPEGVLEPAFPYRNVTIERDTDAYELYDILGEVGRGKFGTVYRCQEKSTGLKLAAKLVPIPKRDDKRNVEREVEIMNALQHHLIIQLYAAYEYKKMMCVVLELVEGGELFDRVVDDEFVLTERVCVVFIRQVCEAMEFIHRNNILHLDLKPENILCLTQEGNRIKLIDFGLARKYDPNKRLQILFGTPEFVAPEVVNFDCISYGTDMWSVGVICYVLISGLSPFMGETDIETMANVTIAKYDFEDESFANVSSECIDFISKLLVKDLSTRMTAKQCMEHSWLRRRPKEAPVIAPKPLNVPPPKLKSETPSPIPPQSDEDESEESKYIDEDELKELDTTKDNLKNFIERWEEHPNSPYVFDMESNVIAPLSETSYKKPHGDDSITSSRVCSPSPCESIDTITDDEAIQNALDNDSPSTAATPINESRERLFVPNNVGNHQSSSGSATPTPTPSQQLFDRHFDDPAYSMSNSSSLFNASSSNLQRRSIQSYLHTFDRRNSDTSYLVTRRSSGGERVNLADEIRKLSDHLLMLAEINAKLGSENKKDAGGLVSETNDANNNSNKSKSIGMRRDDSTTTTTKTTTTNTSDNNKTIKTNHTNKTTSSNTLKSNAKLNSNTNITINTTNASSSASASASASTSPSHFGKTKISSLSMRLQQSIEETPKLGNGAPWRSIINSKSTTTTTAASATESQATKTKKKSTISTISTSNAKSKTISSSPTVSPSNRSTTPGTTETAHSRRAKFRIGAMSRDVPIGLPDTHQAVNLEEAANTTKDCLLHLLEKYNETKVRNPVGRHQSISVDWNMSDNLEYRSMSSINAFFQRHNKIGDNVRQMQARLEGKATTNAKDSNNSEAKGS